MQLNYHFLGLRAKLFLALFGISSAIAIAFSAVLFLHMKNTHVDNLRAEGLATARFIAQKVLISSRYDDSKSSIESIARTNPKILRVKVHQPLQDVDVELFERIRSKSIETKLNLYESFIDVDTPLLSEFDEEIGTLTLQMDTETITKDFNHYAARLVATLLGILIVLSAICYYLAEKFTMRLTRIGNALKELKAGHYQVTTTPGQDEVHQIEMQLYELSSMLRGEREVMLLSAIEALVTALEAKDSYTYGHSGEVANFAVEIATAAGLDEREVFNIRFAALLHDIGKIGIPDHILNKPGRLTPEEWEKVKEHPVVGAKIIAGIPMLKDIASLVLYHHARWDGLGYPEPVSGIDIPLGARIIAVADSLQAMISDRPYRKGMPMLLAMEEIHRGSGTQFDPYVVELAEVLFLYKELDVHSSQGFGRAV